MSKSGLRYPPPHPTTPCISTGCEEIALSMANQKSWLFRGQRIANQQKCHEIMEFLTGTSRDATIEFKSRSNREAAISLVEIYRRVGQQRGKQLRLRDLDWKDQGPWELKHMGNKITVTNRFTGSEGSCVQKGGGVFFIDLAFSEERAVVRMEDGCFKIRCLDLAGGGSVKKADSTKLLAIGNTSGATGGEPAWVPTRRILGKGGVRLPPRLIRGKRFRSFGAGELKDELPPREDDVEATAADETDKDSGSSSGGEPAAKKVAPTALKPKAPPPANDEAKFQPKLKK